MRSCDFCGAGDRQNSTRVERVEWRLRSLENTIEQHTVGGTMDVYDVCPRCKERMRIAIVSAVANMPKPVKEKPA